MYAPHRERAPKVDLDQLAFAQLAHQQPLPRPVVPTRPVPVVPAAPVRRAPYHLVSDNYDIDLQLARQLMQSDEENLDSLESLRLEDVISLRTGPGVKYANAPTRNKRSRHSPPSASPATSSGRGYSLPLPPSEDIKPSDAPALRLSQSHPILVSNIRQQFSDDSARAEGPSGIPRIDRPAVPQPGPSSPPTVPLAAPDSPKPGPSKRTGRQNKRSPAPRRQECKTCGKKFQRPCQLTTHIRSHTGEQPHACHVCSRRFSVLSNCQRHVKLCQKRTRPSIPDEDRLDSPSTAPGSFIAYPESTNTPELSVEPTESGPIRPALTSHASGSGSSGVESPGVVEPYSGSGGYTEPGIFEPPETIYEEPSSEYAPSASGSAYDASRPASYASPGYGSYPSGYATNATEPHSSNSTNDTGYAQDYGRSYADYPQTIQPSLHVQPHQSPSHVHASYPASIVSSNPMYLSPQATGRSIPVPRRATLGGFAAKPMTMPRRQTVVASEFGPEGRSFGTAEARPFGSTEARPFGQAEGRFASAGSGGTSFGPSNTPFVPSDTPNPAFASSPIPPFVSPPNPPFASTPPNPSFIATPPNQSFVFQHSPAPVFEPEIKHETEDNGDTWAPTPGSAFQAQTDYHHSPVAGWAENGPFQTYPESGRAYTNESSRTYGAEPNRTYGSESGQPYGVESSRTYGAESGGQAYGPESGHAYRPEPGYPYPPRPAQMGGFERDGYSYSSSASSYPMQPDSDAGGPTQQQFQSSYGWRNADAQWNGQHCN